MANSCQVSSQDSRQTRAAAVLAASGEKLDAGPSDGHGDGLGITIWGYELAKMGILWDTD